MIRRITIHEVHLSAVHATTHLDIDHAGDSINTVKCGSAILEDLDRINRGERDRIEIDEGGRATGAHRIRSNPAAINQHEGSFWSETTQGGGSASWRESSSIIGDRNRTRIGDGDLLE